MPNPSIIIGPGHHVCVCVPHTCLEKAKLTATGFYYAECILIIHAVGLGPILTPHILHEFSEWAFCLADSEDLVCCGCYAAMLFLVIFKTFSSNPKTTGNERAR